MLDDESKHEAEAGDSRPDGKPTQNIPDHSASQDGKRPVEIGGRGGLDPTRYGDWEKAGRCIDF